MAKQELGLEGLSGSAQGGYSGADILTIRSTTCMVSLGVAIMDNLVGAQIGTLNIINQNETMAAVIASELKL